MSDDDNDGLIRPNEIVAGAVGAGRRARQQYRLHARRLHADCQ